MDAPLAAGLQPLRRRFASTVARGSAPIALLLVALAAQNVVSAYEAVLDRHRQATLARQAGLVQVAASIHGHLDVLHGLLADRLADPSSAPRPAGEVGLPPRDAGPGRGALLASGLAALSPDDQRLMAAAEALFPVQRALRQTAPTLRWSYVFGTPGSFVSIYPWGPLADTPAAERSATLAAYFGYDVYRGAEPGRNPALRFSL